MSGKDAIIQKILSDAKEQSNKLIEDAKNKADSTIRLADTYANDKMQKSIDDAKSQHGDIVNRKKTVANLEVRKLMLSSKQKAIDEAFQNAIDKINDLKKADYLAYIKTLLENNAQDGDMVTICEKDKSRITKTFINSFSKEKGIKLSVNSDLGDFNGGIILSNGNYDKNLTLDVELKMLREEIEPEIANIIFGDNK